MKKTILTFSIIIATVMSCNEASDNISGPTYDRSTLLNNWYEYSIQPRLSEFGAKLNEMELAAKKFKEDKDANSLNSLREKYINAHMAWQRVEMINIGKAEEIYYNSKMNVYPVNTARVTSNISSGSYDFNNANNNAAQGFPTIDYMLYGIGETDEKILEVYGSTDEKHINYLTDITDNMKNITDDVIGSWETYKNDFINSTGNTATSAVNVMVIVFITKRVLELTKLVYLVGFFQLVLFQKMLKGTTLELTQKNLLSKHMTVLLNSLKAGNMVVAHRTLDQVLSQ